MQESTTNAPLPEDFDLASIMRQSTGINDVPNSGQVQPDTQVSEPSEVAESVPIDPPPKTLRRKRSKSTESEVVQITASPSDHYTWKRYTFICDKVIAEKLHDIARNEGHTVSAVMQLMLKRGIEAYEKKHGEVKHSDKSIDELL